MGGAHPTEARLESFGREAMSDRAETWDRLQKWWLAARGNVPNWDIALSCDIGGKPGLILVEAKAHVGELSESGKSEGDSEGSRRNQATIVAAIAEAREDLRLRQCELGSGISHDRSYQLSNRIAFAWKLASEGIPTALVYLGFIGDQEIANVGEPFGSDTEWHKLMRSRLQLADSERQIEVACRTKREFFWVLSRARPAVASPTVSTSS
jgi:hypothetical protein